MSEHRKEIEEPYSSPPTPALFPIDKALLELFEANPADEALNALTSAARSGAANASPCSAATEAGGNDADGATATATATGAGGEAAAAERSEPLLAAAGDRPGKPCLPPAGLTGEPLFARGRMRDDRAALAAGIAAPDPEPRDAELLTLRPWQRRYVLGLRQFGVVMLAAKHANVSRATVCEWRKRDAAFDQACDSAEKDALDAVEAATIQSATVGDVAPVYQSGALVGYKRVKNVKAAELIFKKAGYLDESRKIDVKCETKVELVTGADMVAKVQETIRRLFAARAATPINGRRDP